MKLVQSEQSRRITENKLMLSEAARQAAETCCSHRIPTSWPRSWQKAARAGDGLGSGDAHAAPRNGGGAASGRDGAG